MLGPHPLEKMLCSELATLPRKFDYRYTDEARCGFLQLLFRSLAGGDDAYLRLLFPNGPPTNPHEPWSLRVAQGAVDGAEYTEAARGHPCGHIFKSGEATYRCKTCTVDDTCVLCARCFEASDHEGHMVYVHVSPGNSGCCDCGDAEAWVRPVLCNIHTSFNELGSKAAGKQRASDGDLPSDLIESIRMTVARALDYICDVFSCSPEHLRMSKTADSVLEEEGRSQLGSKYYGHEDTRLRRGEYALVLWNDEKHTIDDVRDMVARACRLKKSVGKEKALEVNDVGRSVLLYSGDLPATLRMASTIEQTKLTVTVRSSRDTFREQMCETIIEWISDLAGCSVGKDPHILRTIICDEMLKPWRKGTESRFIDIGMDGIDDHAIDEVEEDQYMLCAEQGFMDPRVLQRLHQRHRQQRLRTRDAVAAAGAGDEEPPGGEGDEDEMDLVGAAAAGEEDMEMEDADEREDVRPEDDALETSEATIAGYPPPPPPPPAPRQRTQDFTPMGSDDGVSASGDDGPVEPFAFVPVTPMQFVTPFPHTKPASYWLETPAGAARVPGQPPREDLRQRVRLDFLIFFDLRMWKKVRIDMRDLFISTVVTLPAFKRLLGLRFAGLYTRLAELYLVADREPDHSIINLSLQMLTTPSITEEVVERGNFLTVLMAILFTFLTTRQVGPPSKVSSMATLAMQDGTVTNRRMYHFFMDLKYLLGSPHIQERLRNEKRYLMQFLDLVKLHQGICPNTRAVGEHLEYEQDSWINASMVIRETNKLVRQLSDAYSWSRGQDNTSTERAIRDTAKCVIVNSLGCERRRFEQSEIKQEIRFKCRPTWEFDKENPTQPDPTWPSDPFAIVDFTVHTEPMSFHHALHYTLSWLVDRGKGMSADELRSLLCFTQQDLKAPPIPFGIHPVPEHTSERYLLALFDYPLRVCVWLSQILKANMWVRNGVTLKHQAGQYRGVAQRDVTYLRDIFMLQTALVVCPTATFLSQMIDRFCISDWVEGRFDLRQGFEDLQMIEVAQDFVHLLIVILSDRVSILPPDDPSTPAMLAMKKDIIHILCFKPLSFSDFSTKVADKNQESDEFGELLQEMTEFKAPEGLQDVGTFKLKEQYLEEMDPFIAQYSPNQREEAENLYKNYVAKKTGQPAVDVVYEPKPRPNTSGVFKDLAAFTRLPLFAQIINSLLRFSVNSRLHMPKVPVTRIESFLQFVLHLMLLAVAEDMADQPGHSQDDPASFVRMTLTTPMSRAPSYQGTSLALLQALLNMPEYKGCEPRIKLVLRRMHQKQPALYEREMIKLNLPIDRIDTPPPADGSDKELKKRLALERQAKVMAQFKAQQNSFMENQAMDWSDVSDMSDIEDDDNVSGAEEEKTWKFPSGTCILCQEQTDDTKLYGTFAMVAESRILRQTDLTNGEWLDEVVRTPENLDHSAEDIRPFGVARRNRQQVAKAAADGSVFYTERQGVGRGFPHGKCDEGPVSTGCGHIMHFSCFEVYVQATQRRHTNQIARNHPERIEAKEFLCPLCKALGNAFLPIIWKGKREVTLTSEANTIWTDLSAWIERKDRYFKPSTQPAAEWAAEYASSALAPQLASKLSELSLDSRTSYRNTELGVSTFGIPSLFGAHRGADDTVRMPPLGGTETQLPSLRDYIVSGHLGGRNSDFISLSNVMDELHQIYIRLRDTYRQNGMDARTYSLAAINDLGNMETLVKTMAYSIAAAEISQRGVDAEGGSTLLNKLPQHTVTHLRVLAETVASYTAVGMLRHPNGNETRAFVDLGSKLSRQVFDVRRFTPSQCFEESFINKDTFVSFVEGAHFLLPQGGSEEHPSDLSQAKHLLVLCYLAEIMKVMIAFEVKQEPENIYSIVSAAIRELEDRSVTKVIEDPMIGTWSSQEIGAMVSIMDKVGTDFEAVAASIGSKNAYQVAAMYEQLRSEAEHNDFLTLFLRNVNGANARREPGDLPPRIDRLPQWSPPFPAIHVSADIAEKIVKTYALAFLRKAIIFFHVKYGVEFTSSYSDPFVEQDPEPELERLAKALGVPSVWELLSTFLNPTTESAVIGQLAMGWIRHWSISPPTYKSGLAVPLAHPAIFELVGLPKNYDTLTDEAIRKRCPTTGKELTDPSICLFCGEIFCSQAVCCSKNVDDGSRGKVKLGGCAQHLEKCGGNVGLFINIRKCMLLFLHCSHDHKQFNGCFSNAPYLDKHGEADPTLRRHHQLYLNQKRYDALLRNVWLGHGIPSVIARKLEADINTGGWESL